MANAATNVPQAPSGRPAFSAGHPVPVGPPSAINRPRLRSYRRRAGGSPVAPLALTKPSPCRMRNHEIHEKKGGAAPS